VIKAEQDAHLLSEEAQRAAQHLRLDFEKGGIHLCHGTHPLSTIYFVAFHLLLPTNGTSLLALQKNWIGLIS
jgi:hypothetical protein